MIPMNRAYGIRISKAFSSDANWYAINAFGGKLLCAYGLAVMGFGVLARDWAPPPTSIWSAVFVVGPMLPALLLLGFIRAYAKRLPEGP
jgi:hypothetical protein